MTILGNCNTRRQHAGIRGLCDSIVGREMRARYSFSQPTIRNSQEEYGLQQRRTPWSNPQSADGGTGSRIFAHRHYMYVRYSSFRLLRPALLIIHPVEALRIALEKLGYKETNHGSAVFKNMREIEMWTEAVNAKFFGIGKPYGPAEWDQLLGHCMVSGRSYKAPCGN